MTNEEIEGIHVMSMLSCSGVEYHPSREQREEFKRLALLGLSREWMPLEVEAAIRLALYDFDERHKGMMTTIDTSAAREWLDSVARPRR